MGTRWRHVAPATNLAPPTPVERSHDPVACHSWADQWRSYNGSGRLEYATVRFPTGTHQMPQRLVFDGARQAAANSTASALRWQACGTRLTALQSSFPTANFAGVIRRITDLPEPDFQRLAGVATWLKANPTSGMLIRQLPIEGIDTKWLARHARVVLAMLGDAPETDDSDDTAWSLSRRRELHRRLGLRTPPELVQVTVPCPTMRLQTAGMRHLAASVEDLNYWVNGPETVVIIENKETAYAVTTDRPGMVVLHGEGFDVATYASIRWVRTAPRILYWGDIDIPGLHFLDDLRGYGIPAKSIMMDIATLDTFRHLAVEGSAPIRHAVARLSPAEQELYGHLIEYSKTSGRGLLLEQERIPWPHAERILSSAVDDPT